jgi:hypothetical protein
MSTRIGLGVVSAITLGIIGASCSKTPSPVRTPAGSACPVCEDLVKLRSQLLASPSPETAKMGSPKRARLEVADLSVLKAGGKKIALLFKEGSDSAEERAAAEFLVLTAERDPAGVALDWILTELEEKAPAAIQEIEREIRDLRKENAVSEKDAEAFATTLAVVREEIRKGQN